MVPKFKIGQSVWFMPSRMNVLKQSILKILIDGEENSITYTIGNGKYEVKESEVFDTKKELLNTL